MEKSLENLKSLLQHIEEERGFDERDTLLEIIAMATRADGHLANVGYLHDRTKHNDLELAFCEQWKKENLPEPHINNGNGILQDLFIERGPHLFNRKWIIDINNRDRLIVATVIQWLGSNIGQCFLSEALKKCNGRIVFDK